MIVDDQQKDPARGIDPRYDPQFQRGYRPQPGERARTRLRTAPAPAAAPSPAAAASAPAEAPRSIRSADDIAAAEAAARSIAPVPAPATAARELAPAERAEVVNADIVRADLAVTPAVSVLDRIELSPRRNPTMLALWIVGGGFVVLGIVLYSVSVSLSYAGSTPSTDVGALVISQLGWMLAGPLITIGLATLVGLLFLTALAGRRRGPIVYADGADDAPGADER